MQTKLAEFVKARPEHRELENILRACVHCGFCNAVCPTYQLLGDELDGPRGRIYLLKQMLEGGPVSGMTQRHLDRCLSCRSCETTCPSGVRYGRLLDLGRVMVESRVRRPWLDRLRRSLMLAVFPYARRFDLLLRLGWLLKPVLPRELQKKLPQGQGQKSWPPANRARKMLIFSGCVQESLRPSIDFAAASVLQELGISLLRVEATGCCGALNYHLSDHDRALAFARSNIDACWPHVEQGAEAIVMTASACGLMVKEYTRLLQHDRHYAAKAQRISAMTRDISEILAAEDLSRFYRDRQTRVAFQSPCTLQHGQKLSGCVEAILEQTGYRLTAVTNAHLCCGSAGVYALLQPELAERLRHDKLQALQLGAPDIIATANIGCLNHLQSASAIPVKHWIELLQ